MLSALLLQTPHVTAAMKSTWSQFAGLVLALQCRPEGWPLLLLLRAPHLQMALEKDPWLWSPLPPLCYKVWRLSVVFRRPSSRPPMPSPCGAVSPSTSRAAGGFSQQPWALGATPASFCRSSSCKQRQKAIRHLEPLLSPGYVKGKPIAGWIQSCQSLTFTPLSVMQNTVLSGFSRLKFMFPIINVSESADVWRHKLLFEFETWLYMRASCGRDELYYPHNSHS